MKYKRPLAIAAVVIIALLYLSTIIFALMDSPNAQNLLMASLFSTIILPIMFYAYQLVLRNKKEQDESEED